MFISPPAAWQLTKVKARDRPQKKMLRGIELAALAIVSLPSKSHNVCGQTRSGQTGLKPFFS
jgi:hypothetical protein